jgi:cell filamentation protein
MAQQSHSARVAQDNLCDMGRTRAGFPFHFRAVHHHLFQDVFDWAGRDGKLRLTKGTSTFLLSREHRRELKRVFGWLKARRYLKGRTAPNFAAGSAHCLGNSMLFARFEKVTAARSSASWRLWHRRRSSVRLRPPRCPGDARRHDLNGDEQSFTAIIERLIS